MTGPEIDRAADAIRRQILQGPLPGEYTVEQLIKDRFPEASSEDLRRIREEVVPFPFESQGDKTGR